ncbi:MAG: WG repeat-containing protein [Bacteroidota bacterium]
MVKGGKYGMIDVHGNNVFPFEFDVIWEDRYETDNCVFQKNGLFGVMTILGDTILPFEFSKIYSQGWTFVVTDRKGKKGIYDVNGFILLPVEYDEIEDIYLHGHLMMLRKDEKYGLFSNGQLVVPTIYDNMQKQHIEDKPTLFLVTKGKKKGWLKSDGTLLNDTFYQEAELFINGYSRVMLKGKWLEIGTDGELKGKD